MVNLDLVGTRMNELEYDFLKPLTQLSVMYLSASYYQSVESEKLDIGHLYVV